MFQGKMCISCLARRLSGAIILLFCIRWYQRRPSAKKDGGPLSKSCLASWIGEWVDERVRETSFAGALVKKLLLVAKPGCPGASPCVADTRLFVPYGFTNPKSNAQILVLEACTCTLHIQQHPCRTARGNEGTGASEAQQLGRLMHIVVVLIKRRRLHETRIELGDEVWSIEAGHSILCRRWCQSMKFS